MTTIHSVSTDSSEAQPLTPPFLTPMSSYRDEPHPRADTTVVDGETNSITSLPLGPMITADGRTHIPSPEPPESEHGFKLINGYHDQTSPSRFFEPFPEGPIPADQFRPRREFIPSVHAPHEFALLTLAEGNLVRMLGFDEEAVRAVRDVLMSRVGEGQGIRSERRGNAVDAKGRKSSEDRVMSPMSGMQSPVPGELVEWCLEGKPWKERKNRCVALVRIVVPSADSICSSEILLTTLISTLLTHSFHFVSPLHVPSSSSPVHLSAIFSRPLEPSQDRRTAFSISFPAANIIRVIGAPKESTPGILAVVRQGWGTRLKEERTETGAWEGKLKGPGCTCFPS
ncbi:hypothetical protein CALCODRAFT_182478 [Calocera cornea HHB12733]|uniref:Uncharacterized protein n=1 Tax=Calocera cornea HHB12733 TaxID=1353952 RepID=A0A165HS72_9BASI|nr:hypothetical protein CALCODRAFT_182478 [Calocera cornea HHB12733]